MFGESEPPEQLQARSFSAARECDLAYPPPDPKAAVARAKCHTEAWEILRPTMIYPDILDGLIAKRIAIAQQVERRELTVSQGNAAMPRRDPKRRRRSNAEAALPQHRAPTDQLFQLRNDRS
jgi:hypothetical protein